MYIHFEQKTIDIFGNYEHNSFNKAIQFLSYCVFPSVRLYYSIWCEV